MHTFLSLHYSSPPFLLLLLLLSCSMLSCGAHLGTQNSPARDNLLESVTTVVDQSPSSSQNSSSSSFRTLCNDFLLPIFQTGKKMRRWM